MRFQVHVAALALATFIPLVAQAPKGWKVRLDRSTEASDPDASGAIKFAPVGTGFRATNPQAAIYWNPANATSGAYTLKGTFMLMRPSSHANYYGLVFGGSALEGAQQSYLYFVVAQNGMWLVRSRNGTATRTIGGYKSNDAVKVPDATGQSNNALEVRVDPGKVDFVVNGVVVHSEPKTGALAKTDGIYGIRVNHLLEVQIDGLGVSQ